MDKLYSSKQENNALIITINGPLDGISAPYLRIAPLPEETLIILNCSKISFMDSAGVAAIVTLFKALKAGNKTMVITGLHGQPKDLIDTLQLGDAITLAESIDAAYTLSDI